MFAARCADRGEDAVDAARDRLPEAVRDTGPEVGGGALGSGCTPDSRAVRMARVLLLVKVVCEAVR